VGGKTSHIDMGTKIIVHIISPKPGPLLHQVADGLQRFVTEHAEEEDWDGAYLKRTSFHQCEEVSEYLADLFCVQRVETQFVVKMEAIINAPTINTHEDAEAFMDKIGGRVIAEAVHSQGEFSHFEWYEIEQVQHDVF